MGNKQEKLDKLFIEWRSRITTPGPFIEDGLVDEEAWNLAGLRIMVLLKEANSDEDGWKYQDFIRDKGYLQERATWPNLIRWTYGILHEFLPYKYVEERYREIREETVRFFKFVCFANVKKTAGGSQANEEMLLQDAEATSDLLLRQIEILEPGIVLCGGGIVFDIVRNALTKHEETFEARVTDGGLEHLWWPRLRIMIVHYHHPGAHYPQAMSYTYLMNEIQKIL